MPNFDAWRSAGTEAIDSVSRAVEAWRRIQRNPTSVVLRRGALNLTAQTVRIEPERAQAQVGDLPIGEKPRTRAIVFGVKGHPSVSDTDVSHGDRFVYLDMEYRVVSINAYVGELQAQCEAVE